MVEWRWNKEHPFEGLPADGRRDDVWERAQRALTRRWPDAWMDVVVDGPTGMRAVDPRPLPERDAAAPAWLPDATDGPAVARCFRDPVMQVHDVIDAAGTVRGQVAILPIVCTGGVRKVVRVARQEAWSKAERAKLRDLAQGIAARLRERQATATARLTATLSDLPAVAEGSEEVAAAALAHLVPAAGASSGAILVDRGGRLHVLADVGEGADERREVLADGIPRGQGFAWRVLLHGRPEFVASYAESDAAVPDLPIDPHLSLVPLGRRDAHRWVLVLAYPESAPPFDGDLALVRAVAPAVATALELTATTEVDDRLVSLQERLPDLPLSALHPLLLETAAISVPGTDSGSLLVRDDEDAPFAFRATWGYEQGTLDGVHVADADARAWYAPGTEAWGDAAPRVLRPEGDRYLAMARRAGLRRPHGLDPSLARVRADLTVPVRIDGAVRALLVLHSVTRADAFGRDSVRIARQWSLTASALLRVALDRDRVRQQAITDALTGLLNRRGAELELNRALARAARAGQPLSVASIDLGGFKEINDVSGHAAGDRALRSAARALDGAVRAGDVVARWGGDEFLVLLPQQGDGDAGRTAKRLIDALESVQEGSHRLVAHVGTASFPADARTGHDLLRVADRRMYLHKRSPDDRRVACA